MTAFHLLESRLLHEIYNIRLVLSQIQNPHFNPMQHNQFMFPQVNLSPTLYQNISPPPPPPAPPKKTKETPSQVVKPKEPDVSSTTDFYSQRIGYLSTTPPMAELYNTTLASPGTSTPPPPLTTTTEETVRITPRQSLFPFLKSLPSAARKPSGPRDFEIHKFNNTILSGKEAQVFTYFWKIENYTEKVQALKDNSSDLFSPAFVISGFNLRIKATLNHLNRDYLYLRLEEISKEQAHGLSSVILETGDLFHEIETEEAFRYKITVLDQSAKKDDLISQEFTDTTSGFMIPSSALTETTYVKDDLILIKVILYL